MNEDISGSRKIDATGTLRAYLEDSLHNWTQFIEENAEAFAVLEYIDAIFMKAHAIPCDKAEEGLLPIFFSRAHGAFNGAALLCLSGAAPECFMVVRGCIENALYGLHVQRNRAAQKAWIERQRDEEALKKCRDEMKFRKTLNTLAAEDEVLKDAVDALYNECIDYGAHPNVAGHLGTTVVTPRECKVELLATGSALWKRALSATTNGGELALRVFGLHYRDRFDVAGVTRALSEGPPPIP